jgi:hypothetical protein
MPLPSLSSSSTARRRQLPLFLADAATPSDNSEPVDDSLDSTDIEELEELSTRLGRVKNMLGLGKKNKEDDDGLTFRQKLGKAGLAVVLSYGAVSNISYGISMSIAWYGFSRKVRLTSIL